MSTVTKLTDFDAVSTAFDALPLDLSGITVRSAQFPSLSCPLLSSGQDWLPGSMTPHEAASFVHLHEVGYNAFAKGESVEIWEETGCGQPIQYTFSNTVTCMGTMSHPRVEQILVLCAGKELKLVTVMKSFDGEMNFSPVDVSDDYLPTKITCCLEYSDSKALLGGEDGCIYHLQADLAGALIQSGFKTSISNLSWDWKQLLYRSSPVFKFCVDPDRKLAYALHDSGRIEVFSLEESFLSEKPSKVAVYDPPFDLDLMSFTVLPLTGFRDAVLLAVTPSGHLCYFGLDDHVLSRDFTAHDVKKKAKTWCGIGLKQNLKLVHTTSQLANRFGQFTEEGATVEVVAVYQTTIYLSVFKPGPRTSTLWELRNGIGGFQELQQIKSATLRGRIIGMQPSERRRLIFNGAASIEKRLQTHELTMQCFYDALDVIVFSQEQHQRLKLQWPHDVLQSILKKNSTADIEKFMELYSPSETAAMVLHLSIQRNEEAKRCLKDPCMAEAIDEGFMKLFKHQMASIWMAELFECENRRSFIRSEQILRVKWKVCVLEIFKECAEQLSALLATFLKEAGVDIYGDGSVCVHSNSCISHGQGQRLVKFKELPDRFAECMAFLEYISDINVEISMTHSQHKDLLREISLMSARDFLSFALTRREELLQFFTAVTDQMSRSDRARLDEFIEMMGPFFIKTSGPSTKTCVCHQVMTSLKKIEDMLKARPTTPTFDELMLVPHKHKKATNINWEEVFHIWTTHMEVKSFDECRALQRRFYRLPKTILDQPDEQ